jgi:branched-chain amino acid transport system ATP-binding protein
VVGLTPHGCTVEVLDLTLRFGGVTAINGLSFTVPASELLAVVGPNGAGKTAMLNCINGIYGPTSGRILLEGKDVTGTALRKMAAIGVGRAFQHAELFPHLTVLENLLVGRHPRMRAGFLSGAIYLGRARREELSERGVVEAIVDFFELYRYRDDAVGALPYGVQKLVGVARALAAEPSLLLLDEPCTGLIREERENLARFLLRVHHQMRPTIIWVEHDMQMVSDLADRVMVLNCGIKVTEGPPQAVRAHPEVIAAFLGKPVSTLVSESS